MEANFHWIHWIQQITKASIGVYLKVLSVISLHIRSMWETICDAWACWSGWNFGPNSDRIPPILKFRIPPQKWKLSESPNLRVSEYPPKMKVVTESKSESFRIHPQMKIVTESKSESFRIPPQKWKLSQSPNPRVSEYPLPPKWKLSQSPNLRVSEYPPPHTQMRLVTESKSESFRIPPQMKIVTESKSESFRIPPPHPPHTHTNETCHRVQIWEFQNTPLPKIENFSFLS